MKKRYAILAGVTLASLLSIPTLPGLPASAEAASFRVNNRADLPDIDPGDGVCKAAVSTNTDREPLLTCTLRAAVMEANALPGADEIRVPGGRFRLDRKGGFTETEGAFGDLDIVDKLTIIGRGKGRTIIDASALDDRIFDIHDPSIVVMSGMTLRGGEVLGSRATGDQQQTGELECPIVKPADGADGGGLLNRGGIVRLTDMSFEDNFAICDGGGVENQNDGIMLLTDCDFLENVAIGSGGGVENDEDSIMTIGTSRPTLTPAPPPTEGEPNPRGTLVIPPKARFERNNAHENGGAIASDDSFIVIRNAEVRDNLAYGRGGGIWNGDSDVMTVSRSTVTSNDAADGGGIFNNDGFLTLQSTVVQENSPNDIVDFNIQEGLPPDNF
ncbi:MAG: hypothetical protein AB1634_16875 [Thermodesulfobacteriota bacterium]